MIVEKTADSRHAFLVRAQHSPVANHLTRKEFSVAYGESGKIISIESSGRRRDASQHQAVPGGEDLFVATGPDASSPCVIENSARPRDYGVQGLVIDTSSCCRGAAIRRNEEDVLSFEVAAPAGRDSVIGLERAGIGAQQGVQLLFAPNIEFPFVAFAVGIERRIEAAFRRGHLTTDPFDGLDRDATNLSISCCLPQVCAESGEQRVVVQHLLEVWNQPLFIHRVTRESAADLIVDSAAGHFAERGRYHLQRVVCICALPIAQKKIEHHRRGKLRSAAKAAVFGVIALCQRSVNGVEHLASEASTAPRAGEVGLVDLSQLLRTLRDAVPSFRVGIAYRLENFAKRRYAVSVVGRKVSPAVERTSIGQQEHRHRPAAVAGHRLHGLHVDAVDVRPFFAIHFDVDEAVVHEASGLVVLEGLVRHHVAPVTGGVADAQEDRFVFLLGPLERLSSPRVPINRILGVLEQVRTRFFSEAIRHSWRRWSCPDAPRSSRVDGT